MAQKQDIFQQLRFHMVESQIRTNGVIHEGLLTAFENTPRELFVPTDKQKIAYTDKYMPLSKDRALMEPMVHARILQSLNPQPQDVCLDIAGSTGYNAAILSDLVMTIVSLEDDQAQIDQTTERLNKIQACNVVNVFGSLEQGAPQQGPYDIIFINGSVAQVPQSLKEQLTIGGRLGCIIKPKPSAAGQAVILHRISEESFSQEILFEAEMPYLSNFKPKAEFVF